jgi:hypothetical protein
MTWYDMPPHMPKDAATKTCERFGLRDSQFFAYYEYKNLHWTVEISGEEDENNGIFRFGYGDLRDIDILSIMENLEEGEVFLGWNEHQWGDWQQTEHPIIKITRDSITYPVKENK